MCRSSRETLPTSRPPISIDLEFESLSHAWKEDTQYASSLSEITEHPAYQAIIQMGKPVIPLILEDLAKSREWWFMALSDIAGESPVRDEDRGNVEAMTSAWLEWGREKYYITADF